MEESLVSELLAADKYPDFETLARNERVGVDFRILARRARAAFAVVAPHGGGIEPGTSEIAEAVAAEDFSFYAFEGLKPRGNADLHITSTRFDEPLCLELVAVSHVIVTLHGEGSEENGEVIFLGGLDDELGSRFRLSLEARNFDVRRHPDCRLQGLEPENLCNRGITGKGVQLELSGTARRRMFRSLSRAGRQHPTLRFHEFVDAVRRVLGEETQFVPACDGPDGSSSTG
jgi:phage replication-related protein YjqB (UPF0714/DUF867 family)